MPAKEVPQRRVPPDSACSTTWIRRAAKHGKPKHGTVGEESYARQVHTYAKMFMLGRVAIINNDLNAFDDLRNRVGVNAARMVNRVFWSTFMNNSAFFTSSHGNDVTGTGSALVADGA